MPRFVASKVSHNAEKIASIYLMIQNESKVYVQGKTGEFYSVWLGKA